MQLLYIFVPVLVVLTTLSVALYSHIYSQKKPFLLDIIDDRVLLKLHFGNVEIDYKKMEEFFYNLHKIIGHDEIAEDHFSFEIACGSYGIFFLIVVSKQLQKFVEGQIRIQFSDIEIKEVKDYAQNSLNKPPNFGDSFELSLEKEFYFPIKTYNKLEQDLLKDILESASMLRGLEQVWIQILIRPTSNEWHRVGKFYVNLQKAKKETVDGVEKLITLTPERIDELKQIEAKCRKPGFITKIRIVSLGQNEDEVQKRLDNVVALFKGYEEKNLNNIVLKFKNTKSLKDKMKFFANDEENETLNTIEKYVERYLDPEESDILNTEELATIYHFLNLNKKTTEIPLFDKSTLKSKITSLVSLANFPKEK
jgi:hypothetical protein